MLDLFAKGADRYSESHAQKLALLREPFAIAMANALRHQEMVQLKERLASDYRYLQSEMISRSGDKVVGADKGLKQVMQQVARVAPLKNTVLLHGETGVGKEVVAQCHPPPIPAAQPALHHGKLRSHPGEPDRQRAFRP